MLGDRVKALAVGGRVGRLAQRVRQSWQFLSADRECLGWYANDQIAEHYVTRLCSPGGVFVDGGAHIGSITAAVLRHCPGAKVVAVEAIPEKAARLAKKFPTIRVESCALAEQSGQATFYVDLNDTAWSSLAVNERKVREITVHCRKLDDFNIEDTIDVLKLDLEGAELGALRGGEEVVQRDRPTIMFESGPTDYMGYTKSQMYDWLSVRDYRVYLPSRLGKEAPPMSMEVFLDSHHFPFGTLNYFAVPAERVAEISQRVAQLGGQLNTSTSCCVPTHRFMRCLFQAERAMFRVSEARKHREGTSTAQAVNMH